MIAKRFSSPPPPAVPLRPLPTMRRQTESPNASDDAATTPSKTRRKKDMHALQALGEALVALDSARLSDLGLPERLAEAIALARSIGKHEARRRQMQYIGRLMRNVDPEPIRDALERLRTVSHAARAEFATAERWRDRLYADDDALEAFVADHPEVDRNELRDLVLEARAERASGKPPHKYRALFRVVSRATGTRSGTP